METEREKLTGKKNKLVLEQKDKKIQDGNSSEFWKDDEQQIVSLGVINVTLTLFVG